MPPERTPRPEAAPPGILRPAFPTRAPGLVRAAAAVAAFALTLLAAPGPARAGDWPQWRGPLRDGHAAPDETLPDRLPAQLEPRWRIPAGGGFAGPIVHRGRLYVADEQDGRETLRALDPDQGRELWRTPFGPVAGDEWGSGPRCTPVADEDRIYVQSMRGEFACLALEDGRILWTRSFERDFGVAWLGGLETPGAASRRRGHSGSPIVLGDRIVVAVGATNGATLVAFDKRTGRECWRAGHDETAYAPLQSLRRGDREQVVAYTATALAGFDPATGRLEWRQPIQTHANRHVVTPLVAGPGPDLVVSSHTLGLRRYRLPAGPARDGAEPPGLDTAWSAPALKTSIATLVLVGDSLYGQGPDRNFVCVDAATGGVRWSERGFGTQALVAYASTLASRDRLLVLTDSGQLHLVEARPDRYSELGRVQVAGKNWSHPALAGGRLYLRDQRQWQAFDLIPRETPRPRP